MSSRKAAAAKSARRPAANGKPSKKTTMPAKTKVKVIAAKPKLSPEKLSPETAALSNEAIKLAGEIENAFKKSDDAISVEAMQTLMGALCRVYAGQVENGANFTPIAEGQIVSPTGVMVTASGLLRAANLAVFELGMWQSWTGR
jgi:hypothetical protein